MVDLRGNMYRVNKMSKHVQAQHFYPTYEEAIKSAFEGSWDIVKVYDPTGECVYNSNQVG